MDQKIDYNGFKYWRVDTRAGDVNVWRIEFPGGHKTPPLQRASEADIQNEIDQIIASATTP
jgi:hypothetical protein